MTANEIGQNRCCYMKLDVADPEAYRHAIDFFSLHTSGKMNVLFNCAGIMRMGPFDKIDLTEHLKTIRINVDGPVIGTRLALPLLENTPDARVITMSSASAFYGVPDLATYSASKFAVRGFTEALNIELEEKGITVSDLMPLYVNTGMIRSQETRAGSLDRFGARLTPLQIAEIVWECGTRFESTLGTNSHTEITVSVKPVFSLY
jgi:short-subunit dehydrogenase